MISYELLDEGGIEASPEVVYTKSTRVDDMLFSDPETLPRVGDEYQAEIPALTSVPDYIQRVGDGFHHEISRVSASSVTTLVKEENCAVKTKPTEKLGLLNQIRLMDSGEKVGTGESLRCKVDYDMVVTGDSGRLGVKHDSVNTLTDDKTKLSESLGLGQPWSDTEETVFLLGLYIFRKNFDQVKSFIGCMKMEDILSYYYGSFYGSVKYHKWKKKCIRRVYGMKIFSGLRQKELLSRLLPHCTADCQQTIIEVSKTFGDGSISLEEYVFAVKSMVGMNSLIEAVGLGKNKHDLTRVSRESLRSRRGFPVRAEIPIGKDCASLTAEEIVKFLTGDFRLSKAKSSDLFWEAVWPRLLARGWTSLQPKDRNTLVFLMPGIIKFSRRKLTKGGHYFDSVADVLSKVASEPDLLVLESEADNKVNELRDDEKMDGSDFLDQQQHRHQYLQPKVPKRSDQDQVQITVIDTSVPRGEKMKVRKLKSLNVAAPHSSWIRSIEINSDSSKEDNVTNHTSRNQDVLMNGSHSAGTPGKIHRDYNLKKYNDIRATKSKKCPSNQSSSPVFQRRRRLSACRQSETKHESNGFLSSATLKPEDSQNSSNIPDPSLSLEEQYEKLLASISWPQDEPVENNGSTIVDDSHAADQPRDEETQQRTMFDFMSKVVPPEPESIELITTQVDGCKTVDTPANVAITTEQHNQNINPRRQGTRIRPPTTKALEAFAHGYLTVDEKKGRGDNTKTRPYRKRARAKTDITKNASIDDESKKGNELCAPSSSDTMFIESQLQQPKAKEARLSSL